MGRLYLNRVRQICSFGDICHEGQIFRGFNQLDAHKLSSVYTLKFGFEGTERFDNLTDSINEILDELEKGVYDKKP